MIWLLRVLRAVFAVSGLLNIINVLYELMFHPSPNSQLAATIGALWVVACGVLFVWLRSVINWLHARKHGAPHPKLLESMWAL